MKKEEFPPPRLNEVETRGYCLVVYQRHLEKQFNWH